MSDLSRRCVRLRTMCSIMLLWAITGPECGPVATSQRSMGLPLAMISVLSEILRRNGPGS